jgi:hypothetical protein
MMYDPAGKLRVAVKGELELTTSGGLHNAPHEVE